MKSLQQSFYIHSPIGEVWHALTDTAYLYKWLTGSSTMDDSVGTEFRRWGGMIFGKNIEVEKEKMIIQDWFAGKWEKPSVVTITLQEKDGATKIDLLHGNIPDEAFESIDKGWEESFFGPMRKFLESN